MNVLRAAQRRKVGEAEVLRLMLVDGRENHLGF